MTTQKILGQAGFALGLLTLASPAQASDFSGIFAYLIAGFLIGLAVVCAIAWGITRFIEDKSIKAIIWAIAVGGYLLFAFLLQFGF